MKREYIKPAVEVVDLETTEACLQAVSWRVKGENTNPDTDHGYIIEDKDLKPGEYDPWDSKNW